MSTRVLAEQFGISFREAEPRVPGSELGNPEEAPWTFGRHLLPWFDQLLLREPLMRSHSLQARTTKT